jgi:NAD(P)-dependent dehydrogenase (short-subunit alcohol dehydrogenase family)
MFNVEGKRSATSGCILELDGKVAIVTGGSSGIGHAISVLFAKENAKVVIADIKPAEETMAIIRACGGRAEFVKTDVRDSSQVQHLVDETLRLFGTVSIVCNNAGVELVKLLTDTSEDDWNRVIDINLKGPFLVAKHVLPHMIRRKRGAIINTASQLGIVGAENFTAYCASKGGLILLTKAMALEYAHHGIRVNCICPGAVETPMLEREVNLDKRPNEAKMRFISKHPLGRLGSAEEIANAALFLASDKASFVTGEALVVDGGYVAQ